MLCLTLDASIKKFNLSNIDDAEYLYYGKYNLTIINRFNTGKTNNA